MKNEIIMAMFSLCSLSAKAQDFDRWPVPVGPICEMSCSPTHTYFCLWSPTAKEVTVHLYEEGEGMNQLPITIGLQKNSDGTWSQNMPLDLRGKFYTFCVQNERGVYEETPGIFAKAVGVNGQRAQILDLKDTNPEGWEQDRHPAMAGPADAVVYELHHRDFSLDKESGIENRGKFLALTEHGTHTPDGQKTGIDHLVELGVNCVHLLPSYDYGSVDETRLGTPQYNWGYDPVNYNVPEGSYSSNPYDPATRIREFKQMVMALHKAGIRVILDVVYNHVFDLKTSNFEKTAPGYFFRWNADGTPSNGSGCGNETASERPMMRKFMVESVLYWMREYHIDGFRFDLMGIHDIETMQAIRRAVTAECPTAIIYGEGWAAGAPALDERKLAMKANSLTLNGMESFGIAAFGDEMRDGLRGSWNDDSEGAFLIGKAGNEESVKFGIVGACEHPDININKVNYSKAFWTRVPSMMMSYVSCHDDMCLADRLKASAPKADEIERLRLQKLAYAAVLTSQGTPFIWCGDEMARDRKGVHNCYNSPDSVNTIPWKLKAEHRDVYDYIRNLIGLRKAHPAFRMGNHPLATRLNPVSRYLRFLPVKGSNLIAYQLDGKPMNDEWESIVVVLNSNRKVVKVSMPEGEWQVVMVSDGKPQLKTGQLKVPAQSAVILKR